MAAVKTVLKRSAVISLFQTKPSFTWPNFASISSRNEFSTSPLVRDSFNIQDTDDFNEKVLKSKLPVVIDFHATWCGPCKLLAPRLESVLERYVGKLHFAKVDVDDNTDLAIEYDVTAVPAVLGIRNGEVVDRFLGLQDEDIIKSFIDKVVGSPEE